MRIAHSNFYTQFLSDQQRNLRGLEDVYSQTASGQKIQYGYEDTHVYIETLRLEQKETSLTQVKDVSQKAKEFSQQTDEVLGDFTSTLDTFKQKLLAAANDIHSESSRMALANELESLKDHMINLANTSVAGHYLFSGSLIDEKPFNDDGTYNGNDEDLKALIGSNNQVSYNLSGEDVFLSKDTDYYKSVTTNVQHFNQSKLHPDIMTTDNKDGNAEEVYITQDDTLRDMIGDNDDDDTNDAPVTFFLRGKNSEGESVKEQFSLSQGDTVDKLLTKIEEFYDKAVTAEINDWGQIVVTDNQSGSSQLDFHLVGAVDRSGSVDTTAITDIDNLLEDSKLDIVEFVKSGFESEKVVTNTHAINDKYDHRLFTLNSNLVENGVEASGSTKVQDILGTDVANLALSGTDTTGAGVTSNLAITATTTFEELEDEIKTMMGGDTNVSVLVKNGKLTIEDRTIDSDGTSQLSFSMKAQDATSADLVAFGGNEAVIMDREKFTKTESGLTSNISQITKDTNDYATDATKLVDVAGITTLDGKTFDINITDVNGAEKTVALNLSDAGSQFVVTDVATGTSATYDIFNENWTNIGASEMTDVDDAELDAARTAGFDKYAKDTVYVTASDFKNSSGDYEIQVGDYIRVGSEYREVIALGDDGGSLDAAGNPMTNIAGMNDKLAIQIAPVDVTVTPTPPAVPYTVSQPFDHVIQPDENVELIRSTTTTADNFTYGQLNDIVSMVTSANLPASAPGNKQPDYYDAIKDAQEDVSVVMNSKGQMEIEDMKNSPSSIELSIYDSSTNDFSGNEKAPVLSFQSNNALTVDDQHVNFFDRLQDAIDSVTEGIYNADADSSDPRNTGIQNAIKSIDHMNDHMSKMQTVAGSQSQKLQYSIERTEVMMIHVAELRSNVIDADLAEVANELNQRTLNYQAMLASVSKINGLSLVNYM
jgi:flagellar hook-associated protein 3 FlgL